MWQNVCLLDSNPVNLHFLKKMNSEFIEIEGINANRAYPSYTNCKLSLNKPVIKLCALANTGAAIATRSE